MTDITTNKGNSRLFKGGIWAIAARWSVKFLGMLSTLFIVRLLAPQDFGIIMKVMVISIPIKTFVQIGFSDTLIRIRNPLKAHYDTAFTSNMILSLLVAAIMFVTAPLLAIIFNEDLLTFLLRILSIQIVLIGFINPKIKDFLREFQYTKDFKFLIYCKTINILCTIATCFYYRNYYGMIIGQVGGALGSVVISYFLVAYKPSFSLKYIQDFADFSFPNMRAGFGDNIITTLDRILLARFLENIPLGFYNLACQLAEQFTTEVIHPLARGFFPVFSELEHDKAKLRETYLNGLSFLIPFCLAIGFGLSLISEPLIKVYAGEKWLKSVPMLSFLALSSAAQAFCIVNASVMAATGWIKTRAALTNSNAILSGIFMLPYAIKGDIAHVLIIKLSVSGCFVFINLYYISKILKIGYINIIKSMTRPIISTIAMYHTLPYIDITHPVLELFGLFFVGLSVFMITQYTLWVIMGCPESIEQSILDYINKYIIPKKQI